MKPDHDRNYLSLFGRVPPEEVINLQSQNHNNDDQSNRDIHNEDCVVDELSENIEDFEKISEHSGTEEDIWDFHVESDAMEQFPWAVLQHDDIPNEQEFTDSGSLPILDTIINIKPIPSHLLLNF